MNTKARKYDQIFIKEFEFFYSYNTHSHTYTHLKKTPCQDYFTYKFCHTFKSTIKHLHKIFQKVEKGGTLSNKFYVVSIITSIPKSEKDGKGKENYRPMSLMILDIRSL